MTPRETFDIAEVFYEERQRQEKESWKQIRWQTAWFVNMFAKRAVKEVDLFRFSDEIVKVDFDERRQQALATAEHHAKMAPRILKRGKDGKALIYGENN